MDDALADLRADRLADPSLLIYGGAYHLYVSRQRGTRWATALLASHELAIWRPVDDGDAVLAGQDEDAERLGVRGADALPMGDRIEVVHEGLDGLSGSLRFAARPATEAGEL